MTSARHRLDTEGHVVSSGRGMDVFPCPFPFPPSAVKKKQRNLSVPLGGSPASPGTKSPRRRSGRSSRGRPLCRWFDFVPTARHTRRLSYYSRNPSRGRPWRARRHSRARGRFAEACRVVGARASARPTIRGLENIFGRVKSCHKPPTLCFPRELLYTSWRAVCVKAVRGGVRSDIARREWLQSDALTAG